MRINDEDDHGDDHNDVGDRDDDHQNHIHSFFAASQPNVVLVPEHNI